MLHISIVTLFPDMFRGPFDESIIARASKSGAITISYIDIRTFAAGPHRSVDDRPYGGGTGMILRVDIVDKALRFAKAAIPNVSTRTILLDPQGIVYTQSIAKRLTTHEHLIFLCGHYETVDERIRSLVDEEISIGDYILTGGEIPAMVLVDSIVRLLPGVLKKQSAPVDESFTGNLLEYPQYTRPAIYKNKKVPPILLSGNHHTIQQWKQAESLKRTKKRRPDLLGFGTLR